MAFGSHSFRGIMETNPKASDTNRLVSADSHEATVPNDRMTVTVDTLDHFLTEQPVSSIDYLKIDTEGHDLEVLTGATSTLQARKLQVIQVEAAMNPENKLHVPLQHFVDFLYPHDFLLFGLYEQVHEWPTSEVHLRRSNAVFISRELVASHRGLKPS